MLKVGVNTYITPEESMLLLQWEPRGQDWIGLAAERKEYYLQCAAFQIDSQPFAGRKSRPEQHMAFPRNGSKSVPEAVKLAQALEALALSDTQAAFRRQLQEQGVTSISLGKASESYGTDRGGSGLADSEARRLLRPYLLGGAVLA